MLAFDKKLVAVLNKTIEPGKIMNALAHMTVSLGAKVGASALALVDYYDKEQNCYPKISKMPFIVLRATSNKIKHLNHQANEQGITHSTFTHAMTVGSWDEQLAASRKHTRDELIFYGIVMYGDIEKINEMTRKFSLWK